MSGVNPQGVRVESFKVPSARELDQDFLRRYQEQLPSRGEIAIFNRSHYEEVLVVRVHPENLVRQKLPTQTREHHVWERRYEAINDWERYLSRNGIRIVKIFLNLSKEEQRVRFLRRIDLPEHRWKFSFHDVEERRSWDAYQDAFSEMLSHTSTAWAPWYVIPADRKWFARIGAGAVIAQALIDIDPQYPTLDDDALRDLQAAKTQLESEAPDGAAPDPFAAQETRTPVGTLAGTEG
jgi:PPK2 family polyphosphate:nucleotide phosphotransferase